MMKRCNRYAPVYKNKLSETETELLAKNVEIERLRSELEGKGENTVETMEQEVLAEQDATEAAEDTAEDAAEDAEDTAEDTAEDATEDTAEDAADPKPPVTELADSTVADLGIEMKPLRTRVDENQLTIDIAPEAEAEPEQKPEDKADSTLSIEKEKQKAQKRVRSMFDLITFDNV